MADTTASRLEHVFGAGWLMEQHFPDIRFLVPGIIPEGLTFLVAAPKIGKSWMVLGLGIAAAGHGNAFGVIETGRPRPVLYCALEDGPRRLQSRLRALNATGLTDVLQFVTKIPKGGVLETMQEFVDKFADCEPVIILDTLGKAMPPAIQGESAYERDYRVGGAIKAVADSVEGCSIVVVHHTRKADGVDFIDAVSGTQGLAGSADTILLLKRERQTKNATLQVTSRDAAEGEYSLVIEGAGSWVLNGGSLQEAADAARTAKVTEGVGDRMADVIATVGRFPEGIKPRDIKALLPDVPAGQIDKYLERAVEAGRITKPSRGLYTPVRSVRSVSFQPGQSDRTDTSDTPLRLVGTDET